jgi:hypothetical protein
MAWGIESQTSFAALGDAERGTSKSNAAKSDSAYAS